MKRVQTLSTRCPNPACSQPPNHTHLLVRIPYFAQIICFFQAQCTHHPTCGYQKQPFSAESADKSSPVQVDAQLAKGKKCVVTKYSLAQWFSQLFQVDLQNLHSIKPSHMTQHSYNTLKKTVLKDYIKQADEPF